MAYDNFENTPFDLDHDGHIDSNEAAYIHDTLYKEETDSSVDIDDDDSAGDGWYPTKDERAKHKAEMEQLLRDVRAEKRRHMVITVVVIIAIGLLINNDILAVVVLFGLYILGTMLDFWR